MQRWAAIDIMGGRVVSLLNGNPSSPTDWGIAPVVAARKWQRAGVDGLHLVDLDRAFGNQANEEAVRGILEEASIPVQVGGGIRDVRGALGILEMGVTRVVVGTLAYSNPEAVRELIGRVGAESVVVAADYKDGRVHTHGWRRDEKMGILEAPGFLQKIGVGTVLVTAVERDGTAKGPDFGTYRRLRETTSMSILASGGIRSDEDVRKLSDLGLEGVILGRALYEGSIKLAEPGKATT